jgi:hypothetical protein
MDVLLDCLLFEMVAKASDTQNTCYLAGNCRSKNVVDIQKGFRDAFNALDSGETDAAFKRRV